MDTKSVAETVEAERLVIKIVVVDGLDGVEKYKEIALLLRGTLVA